MAGFLSSETLLLTGWQCLPRKFCLDWLRSPRRANSLQSPSSDRSVSTFSKYLVTYSVGRGEGASREMTCPQVFTSVLEAVTLAPNPVSFKGLDPNKTSNQKFSLFQFSKTYSTKAEREREREREKGLLFDSALSFPNSHLNPSSEVPHSIPGKEQLIHCDKSKLHFIDPNRSTSSHPDQGTTRNPLFVSPTRSFLNSTCQCSHLRKEGGI